MCKLHLTVFLILYEVLHLKAVEFFMNHREVDVIGIFRYKNTWPLCLEFIRSGKINVKPLITHRFGFSQQEVEEAFETSARGGTAIKVMFNL